MRFLIVGFLIAAASTPSAVATPAGAAACSGCHPSALDVATPVPRLIGLAKGEMVKAMQEFRAGRRPATVMDRIARGFSDEEIAAIADWYASQR